MKKKIPISKQFPISFLSVSFSNWDRQSSYSQALPLLVVVLFFSGSFAASARKTVYVANFSPVPGSIQRVYYDGSGTQTIISGLARPQGIALDLVNDKIYWAESSGGRIGRANLDGSNVETVLSVGSPLSVAVDPAAGKIYYTDNGAVVRRANLDGTGVQTFGFAGRGLALDLVNNKVYVSGSSVGRANLDGTDFEPLTSAGSETQEYLTVDPIGGNAFFTSTGNGNKRIVRIDLDGGNANWSFINDFGLNDFPWGVAADSDSGRLFWRQQQVLRRSESNGTGRLTLASLPFSSGGLALDNRNVAPSAANLAINPANANELDNLVASHTYFDIDGDPQSGTQLRWYRNGIHQPALDDTTPVPASAVFDGDEWHFTVRPSDGFDFGTEVQSPTKVISNIAPIASNLSITPVNPNANRTLGASYAYQDSNNDPQNGSEIRWFRNNLAQPEHDDSVTVPPSGTSEGDQWHFTVRPSDGIDFGVLQTSPTVTLLNLAPDVANLAVTPTMPFPNNNLALTYTFSDPNGDTQSGTEIRWFRNGIEAGFNDRTAVSANATGEGETWHATVRGSDGDLFGPVRQSPSVVIRSNLPPDAVDLSISPANPILNDDLRIDYTFEDPNGELESGTEIRWFRDGINAGFDDLRTVPASATGANEAWFCTVRVSDGALFGPVRQSPTVFIQPDCLLTATTVSFTTLGTFTTNQLRTGGLTITGTLSPGVPGTINVLNFNGIGVVGGVSGNSIDGSEGFRFSFDDGPVGGIVYHVASAGNLNGNGTVGDAFVEAFDGSGTSMGVVSLNGTGARDVSGLYGGQPISVFDLWMDGDVMRIAELEFLPSTVVTFSVTGFEVSEAGVFAGRELSLSRSGNLECPSTVVVHLIGGSATAGDDFDGSTFPMSVRFDAGQSNISVAITVHQDDLIEPVETIEFGLTPIANASVGGSGSALLSLVDDEVSNRLEIGWAAGRSNVVLRYFVTEGGLYEFQSRTDLADGASWLVEPGSAVTGSVYDVLRWTNAVPSGVRQKYFRALRR